MKSMTTLHTTLAKAMVLTRYRGGTIAAAAIAGVLARYARGL